MPIARTLGAWMVMAVAMSANGVLRELVIRPTLGRAADVISALLGAALILGIAAIFFRALRGERTNVLARMSVLLVALTVAFELLIGRTIDHKTWGELVANYAIWRGHLWPLVLAVVAASPFIYGRGPRRDRTAQLRSFATTDTRGI